jgi:hypothetical protein
MSGRPDRVRVVYTCPAKHEHELCVTVSRGVPAELRCPPEQSTGFGGGGGGGCAIPPDLQGRVEQELRDNFQESKRRGFVLIAA